MYKHLLRRIDRLQGLYRTRLRIGSDRIGSDRIGSDRIGSGQVRSGQVRSGQVRIWGLSLIVALLCMHKAQADGTWDDCRRGNGVPPLYYQWYSPATVYLGNNVEIGDVIGPWISSSPSLAWTCKRRNIYAGTPVQVSVQGYPPYEHWNRFISHDGQTYGWYRLGDDNWALGYITRWRAIIDGIATEWTPLTKYPGYQEANSSVIVTKDAGEIYDIHVETQVRLVKQNMPDFARNVLVPGYQQRIADPIYVRHYQKVGTKTFPGDGSYLIGQMPLGTITITGGESCTTPNVHVKLPTVATSHFSAPGSSLGTKTFELEFQNCPPGYYRIGYYLTPASAILDATQGVIALDSQSTATGVGLQLTDDNGVPLKFGAIHRYQLAYDTSITKSYSVPLKAAYYQTGNTVTPGKVRASVTVKVTYQ